MLPGSRSQERETRSASTQCQSMAVQPFLDMQIPRCEPAAPVEQIRTFPPESGRTASHGTALIVGPVAVMRRIDVVEQRSRGGKDWKVRVATADGKAFKLPAPLDSTNGSDPEFSARVGQINDRWHAITEHTPHG